MGQKGNKSSKFVEAAKGTNLFFAVFGTEKVTTENDEKSTIRSYMTIPLNVMINCQKTYGTIWKENLEVYLKEAGLTTTGSRLLFILSPNDLVYLPTEEERRTSSMNYNRNRIYKIVSFSNSRLYAVPYSMAKSLVDKVEYTQLNKMEFTDEKESIREICVPIKVDRLGNIIR